jgi:patatin-like phospholipase
VSIGPWGRRCDLGDRLAIAQRILTGTVRAHRLGQTIGGGTVPARTSRLGRWLCERFCNDDGDALDPCGDQGIVDTVRAVDRRAASRWHGKQWRRYLAFGRRPEPIPSYTGVIENPEAEKIGIACSGGGIRSAAFSLGALQVLQREKVLEKTCYLAGVSGGSYIAAAFCMVRKRWTGHQRPKQGQTGWDDSDPDAVDENHPPFFPGSPEEQYLRNRSAYLAPGALGKVRLGYRLILGLGINLGFIAVFLITVAVALAIAYGGIYPALAQHLDSDGLCHSTPCHFTPLTIPPAVYWPLVGLGAVAVVMGGGSIVAYLWMPSLRHVTEAWSVRLMLLAFVGGAILIGIPILLSLVRAWGEATGVSTTEPASGVGAASVGGVATLGAAVVLHLRAEWVEFSKLAQKAKGAAKWYSGLGQRLRRMLAYLIAAIVGPALALGLMLVAMSATLNLVHPHTRWIVFGAAGALFLLLYSVADLTTWSLHPFYRRRLCTAFALKRVRRPEGTPPIARGESGVAVERDYQDTVQLSQTAIEADPDGRRRWPTLLVCAAANISDDAATPPGRAVTTFTFSAASMGGPLVGAVKTADFEDACDRRRNSYFTLPAAVAMSGAALSPSMGKLTRRPLRLLMALANVRLGVWVPNPRRIERFRRRKRFYPRPRPSYLLREMLGRNPINASFLYVTDGGHYENLGVVELLRRGCTEIYCFDAGNDKFDALGDVVSLARSELNVQIDVDTSALEPDDKTQLAEEDCVCGTITYPGEGAPKGKLYYARTVMTENAPADAVTYQARDSRFPHNPTVDQLYTDQRFEAYRALGACAGRHALEKSRRVLSP